jgi:5-methylcytosine-specific restriction endonuclease McrA
MFLVNKMTKKFTKRNEYNYEAGKKEDKEWRSGVYKKVVYKTNPNWKKIRAAILFRDGFMCIRCETGKNRRNLTIHHLIPRSEGGEDYSENLITLCPECHDYVEVQDLRTLTDIVASYDLPNKEKEVKEKTVTAIEEDMFPRPVWHKYVYGGVRHSD